MRRQLIRLLRYSTSEWEILPIFHVHKMEVKEETRSLHQHKTVNQEKFSQKELTNSLTKKVTFTWQREDTVHPTDLSTLQFGRPQVPPPLQI